MTSTGASRKPSARNRPGVAVSVYATSGRQHAPFVAGKLARACALLPGCQLRELSLAMVGDVRMSALHREFMGLDEPTDVLTFPLETDARGRSLSGEIVVCVPEAQRQARARRIPLRRELLLYAIHGLLHLSGFDDRTPDEFREMHRTEDMILTRLGVGPAFFAAARPHRGRTGLGGRSC